MFGSGSGAFSGGAGNTSGFGQSAFGKPAAPTVFGQTNTSLFNQPTQPNTGLFGTTAAAPAFGQTPTAQPTFGGFNANQTSLFGTPTATPASAGGLFSQQNASMVANAGSGIFGSNNPNSSFGQSKPVGTGFSFGAPAAQPTGNIFGTPQTSTASTGMFGATNTGTFGATPGFGAASAGGTTLKFNPVTGTDIMVKNGVNQTINTRHQSITVMKEYENKIFEELRYEDYSANRKVGQQGAVGSGLFGSSKPLFSSTATTSTGLFGASENKQLFGSSSTTPAMGGFGTTGTTNVFGAQNSIFGKPQQTTPAFGAQAPNQSFGMNATQPSIFGANTAQTSKPFGVAAPQTNIFGSTAPSTFGTQTTTAFGQTAAFGQTNQNNLFGQSKPGFGLGATQTTTGGFGFGTNTSTSANGLFGSKPANTGFQMTTPAFGTNNAFGATPAAQPATGSLFGSNAFNKTPTTTLFNQPANQQIGVFNNAAKPIQGGLFGQGTQGTGIFGSSNTNNFGTGSSFFGANQQAGGIGLFGNTNNVQLAPNQGSQSNQIQLQLDTLKAMPYGDSPLFKRFYKDVSKVDDSSLVRTQNVSLEKFGSYKVSPIPTPKSTPQVRRSFPQFNRKSLFDGLEESPPSLKNRENKIVDNSLLLNVSSPRSGCKKLILKKDSNDCSKLNSGNSMIMHTKPLAKLELYFSNKQGSPENNSQKLDLSINEENNTFAQLHSNQQVSLNTSKETEINDTLKNNVTDSVIDNQDPSIDPDAPEAEDHPTGIKLRRIGYYTIPPMNELVELVNEDRSCFVDGFTIGRYDYGNVYFPDRFNIAGLDLDSIVHIRHREIIIYQDDENKPPLGEGLNRKATVTLDRVWPNDKTTKQPITNPDRIAATNFVVKLQRACAKLSSQFVDYRSDTGSWVFNVDHFSKYALIDSDDEDEGNIVVNNIESKTLPKPISQKPKPAENLSPKQNVMKPMLDLSVGLDRTQLPHQYLLKPSMQLSTVNQVSDDSHIMHYYVNNKENSVNVTAQLSQQMNLQAHKIQCMKASFDDIFYNEFEPMEQDDDTYEQKDKFEDKLEKILETIPEYIISPKHHDGFSKSKSIITPVDNQVSPKCFISKQKKKVQVVEVLKPVLTAPLQAQRFSLKYGSSIRLPFEIQLDNSSESSKLTLLDTSSIKIPWSNNLSFISLNTKSKQSSVSSKGMDISYLATELSGRGKDDYSSTVIQKIQIITPFPTESFIELLTEHLKICITNSNCNIEKDNLPYFYPTSGVDGLHSHCYLLAQFSELPEEERYTHVWELIKALWGDPENLYTKDCPQEHVYNMARRQAVSDWLETILEKKVDFKNTNDNISKRILKLVSAHKIMEACDLAISNNELNLAMLLAQLGSENSVRCCIQRQLWQWFNSKADMFIDIDHLKLYTMISGQPLFDSNQGIVNVCENLDWIRAFALHMWYIQPPSGTIGDALDAYENSFESDDPYACRPYYTYDGCSMDNNDKFATFDVCFHLMKLYTNSAYEIYKIVNPLSHTRDPLDYSFSWLLYNTLQSLGYTQMSDTYANQLHSNFASQLVSHGLWHWAVFILLHIKDDQLRESSIEEVIGRNVDLPKGDIEDIILTEKEKFVVEKLNIENGLIYNAKAILAATHKKYLEATICYLKAKQWEEAHRVLVGHLLADFILQKDGKKTLKHLLNWLIEGSKVNDLVPTFMLDSSTLLDYLKFDEKLNKMSSDKAIAYTISLCERLSCFSEKTIEERMIKTEVSSSIAHKVGKLMSKIAPTDHKILKSLVEPLTKLTLTEDYALDELVLAISHCI